MNERSPAAWFAALSVSNKTIVLCRIVYEFTLVIRAARHPSIDAIGERAIQGVGELTHRIMPYLIALNQGDKDRIPDEELINLLFTAVGDYGFEKQFQRAWQAAAALLSQD